MIKQFINLAIVGGFGIALAGCGGSGNPVFSPGPPAPGGGGGGGNATYTQIERLSRPAVKEVFETFVQHQTTNAVEPYNSNGDPLFGSIKATEDTLRPPTATADYGAALQTVLYPDVLQVNLDGTTAGYLGVETKTAAANFGGRNPNDDVIATSLGAIFGNTLPKLGLVPEDGQENNCLLTENVAPTVASTGTFPYLAGPH